MKKYYILLIAVISCNYSVGQIRLGFKAGANLSNAKIEKGGNYDWKPGYYGGAFIKIILTDKITLQPEVSYSLKGFKTVSETYSYYTKTGEIDYNYNLNYISLPFLIGFMPIRNLTLLTGPSLSFLINANAKIDGHKSDVTNSFNKTNWGINSGIVFNVSKSIGINFSYDHDLTGDLNLSLTDKEGRFPIGEKSNKNRAFQLGLSYLFSKRL